MPPNRIEQLVHDARGPLNTISVNAEVARLLIQKAAPTDEVLAAMQNILRECQRCNDILQLIGTEGLPPEAAEGLRSAGEAGRLPSGS